MTMEDDFHKRWVGIANKIETQPLDSDQAFAIKNKFILEYNYKSLFNSSKFVDLFIELNTDLDVALEIAYSNYRSEQLKNKSFWSVSLLGQSLSKLPQPEFKR